ncbi:succinylarginine dihydrolase [Legionella geestiana]|uniref:N-succinylarginine dihydrolase n=1 Tax=Legionella geestiana TaxID=45065 RepID=A0A0W0TWT6_9GAMM|nr:N-succinylarginine dihydrolase [Legionella geestiana]KTD00164.1 succinylarginine dihydrolase [Legionella geestiana]QBS11792.1 N-succinylarginine dihydrolase [Legionella geestiana]QDQ40594.1 N-succinylarginine dihydrolase [Legionella geestiana]STX53515.1 succinylarginine dihydrolase [Legionella geestiana]
MPELNLDGLVGPTHHYAGLSEGNLASTSNARKPANPQAAALQGIAKMRHLTEAGIPQGILPPHARPNLPLLHSLGFTGDMHQCLAKAAHEAPMLLSAAFSASSMWTANAATVSPAADTADGRVHFTAANLVTNLHRHQEADFSAFLLARIFENAEYFCHHAPLPRTSAMGDEGAANHNRLCATHDSEGLHLFVYGKQALLRHSQHAGPRRYPARQTLEASEAIARRHLLNPERVVYACQNPRAIDAGVFHNDVIATVNESVMLMHEDAFVDQEALLETLKRMVNFPLMVITASREDFSLSDAVESYLFNSQLITCPDGGMMLIAPVECRENERVHAFVERMLQDASNPVNQVHYLDLRQSMRNGGGPACLRLRVPLTGMALQNMHQGVLATPERLNALEVWVRRHYRDRLEATDLVSSAFVRECEEALDALTQLLDLGSVYPFQQE